MSYLRDKAGDAKTWEVMGSSAVEPIGYVVAFANAYAAYSYDDHRPLGSRRDLAAAHALVDRDAETEAAETEAHNARVLAIIAAMDATPEEAA